MLTKEQLEAYAEQNPVKYALKKEALEAKLGQKPKVEEEPEPKVKVTVVSKEASSESIADKIKKVIKK